MPGTFEFAEVSYTLTDCIVAAYNKNANTYGIPAPLASGQMVDVEFEHDTDQLRGYGVKTALLSVPVGAKLKVGAGGVDFSVLAITGGVTNYTSGTTPTQMRRTRLTGGGAGLPYFGMIGVAATDDGGTMVVGLQACKLDMYPKFTMDGKENKFNLSEMGGYAIPVTLASALTIAVAREFETASSFIAPTTGAQFLAFFTSD